MLKKINDNSKRGFSIAEAMMTLLIVSIMLAAMAPIMSKRRVSGGSSTSGVPEGAIMFFNLNRCPPTWSRLSNNNNNNFTGAVLTVFSEGDTLGSVSQPQYVETNNNNNGIAIKTVPYILCQKNANEEEGN